jgi:hypothetical protein
VARIDEGELARLKVEASLVRLVEAKGIALVKHGAGGDLVGRCPFHEDRAPSFVVSPSKNLWRCHGACQVGGSVVGFVMRVEGVSFRHALDLLRPGCDVWSGCRAAAAEGVERGQVAAAGVVVGRIIGGFTMIVGISTFALVTAKIAQMLVRDDD